MNKLQKFWRLLTIAAIMSSALNLSLMPATPVRAAGTAVSLTDFSTYSQNFDSIGTAATATLPTDWKADKQTIARVVGTYAAAVSATEQRAGDNMSPTAANGIYNYGAGDPTTATDRAIGFVSSSSSTKSGNLYTYLKNETGNDLSSFTVSYDVEKYRNGSNAAGFSLQLYYSLNGTTWTSAGSNFLTSFPADADNLGYASAPGATTSVSNQTLTVAVPNGSDFYLAWNYAVTSGTTTSNAQALGIDNVSITPVSAVPPLPSLSIDDKTVTEGDAGTITASFTVTLSEAAPAGGVSFDIATSDGTATIADNDYDANSATGATIAEGATTYSFDVTVNGDTDIEADETFNVTISNPTGATISDATGVGTITNDDFPAFSLNINDVSQAEGNSGTSTFTFTATLSTPAPAGGVTFNIATADSTATVGDNDYVANAVTGAEIAEGETIYTFDVTVNGDTNVEADEAFFVNLSDATGATITDAQGVGTITNDDLGLSINDVAVTEGNAGTVSASFTVTLTEISASDVTFDIVTADNTATVADNDYVAKSVTPATISAGNTTYTFDVTVNGDINVEANETFHVNLSNASGATITDAQGVGTITNDDAAATPICDIQGSGASTPLSGVHTIQGVVVGDFEGGVSPQIRGFYVQQENCDANPATSDGIFVYNGDNQNQVIVGNLVRVTGTVGENQGQTQLSSISNITVLGSGSAVTPTDISLPFASEAEKEQYEGMLVRFNQTLAVTEHYQLGRFGQVTLSSGKLWQPTGVAEPGAAAAAIQAANNLNKIILDDSNMTQNPDPILFGRGGLELSASNTLRGGDTVTNLTGVLIYNWGGNSASPNAYRILPVNAMGGGIPDFVAANARPATPPAVGGSLKVAGLNLLNYFNTFTNCTNGLGGTPSTSNCRGAENTIEFERQAAKTVAAIVAMDADVIGIVEIENDGYASTSAIYDLVTRLNATAGAGTYAFVDVDAETGLTNAMGTDGIKNGLLYKPAKVSMVGDTAVLNTVAFVNGGDSAPRNRVSLLQAFEEIATGEIFLANVNHLKSKGSACDDADAGDGQGNCNIVRTNAALELADWIALDDPTGTGDPDVIILGDLNSYAMEDPIAALEGEGYINLGYYFNGEENYSYVFDGQWGYLDYAMASESLLSQVTDAQEWHINSDEPSVLDYNTNFKSAGQIVSLYAPDQYRISDHDPVIVGLNLGLGKISPSNGAIDVPLSPTLSWSTSDGATSYEYCYSSAPGPCTKWNPVGSDTSVTLSGLAPNYTYYWQVRAVDAGGTTEANGGTWWSFTTTAVSACTWPPYTPPATPTFGDVPMDAGHWSWVERLANSTITAGCGAGNYCPFSEVNRAQMAIFLLRGKHCGSSYTPPAVGASTGFADVPLDASYAPWVKQLAAEGITAGCGGGNFCPQTVVNRAQMAIFLLRAKHGATYSPPAVGASTGFGDVPLEASYAPWVKQLAAEGVTAGCGSGNFCPLQNVNRAQMATFLVRAFGLP